MGRIHRGALHLLAVLAPAASVAVLARRALQERQDFLVKTDQRAHQELLGSVEPAVLVAQAAQAEGLVLAEPTEPTALPEPAVLVAPAASVEPVALVAPVADQDLVVLLAQQELLASLVTLAPVGHQRLPRCLIKQTHRPDTLTCRLALPRNDRDRPARG